MKSTPLLSLGGLKKGKLVRGSALKISVLPAMLSHMLAQDSCRRGFLQVWLAGVDTKTPAPPGSE